MNEVLIYTRWQFQGEKIGAIALDFMLGGKSVRMMYAALSNKGNFVRVMMSRSTFQRLRVFSVVGLCLLLSACCSVHPLDKAITQGDELWCAPNPESGLVGCIIAEKGEPICPVELNVAQCFFYGYELAPLRPEPLEELRKALHDALELPIEELEKKRYVGDDTIQNPSAVEIIGRYFGSNALIRGLGRVWYKTDGFLPALKQPESVPALKKALAEVDEAIRRCEETKDCLEPF